MLGTLSGEPVNLGVEGAPAFLHGEYSMSCLPRKPTRLLNGARGRQTSMTSAFTQWNLGNKRAVSVGCRNFCGGAFGAVAHDNESVHRTIVQREGRSDESGVTPSAGSLPSWKILLRWSTCTILDSKDLAASAVIIA